MALTFALAYGGGHSAVEATIASLLLERGWLPASSWAAADLVWAPASRVPWELLVAPRPRPRLVACLPLRSALVRKDALRRTLRERLLGAARRQPGLPRVALAQIANSSPDFLDVEAARRSCGVEATLARLFDACGMAGSEDERWVLKEASTNNALGLRFVSRAELRALLRPLFMPTPGPAAPIPRLVAERYVVSPLLLEGRKFHLRLNVLAIGRLAVFVHRDVICHVASEPFVLDRFDDPFVHVTNNAMQRCHPAYERRRHTVLLHEAVARINKAEAAGAAEGEPYAPLCAAAIFDELCALVHDVFAVLVQGKALAWPPLPGRLDAAAAPDPALPPSAFLPMAGAFELFGFDVLLSTAPVTFEAGVGTHLSGTDGPVASCRQLFPVVLEVNAGPALEGVAWPMMCRRVVGDALELVCGALAALQAAAEGGGGSGAGRDGPPPPAQVGDFLRCF